MKVEKPYSLFLRRLTEGAVLLQLSKLLARLREHGDQAREVLTT